jgi:hypothetical protein
VVIVTRSAILNRLVATLLIAALGGGGCAAARGNAMPPTPAGDALAAPDAVPPDAPDEIASVATSLLLVGAIAAAVVLGAHGGALSPSLDLTPRAPADDERSSAARCVREPARCDVATPATSPG